MTRYALIAVKKDGRAIMELVGFFDDGDKAWREARKLTRAHRGKSVYVVRPVKESIIDKVMDRRWIG